MSLSFAVQSLIAPRQSNHSHSRNIHCVERIDSES